VRVWDVTNRFGSIRVQTRRPRMLWIPANVDESSPPPAPPGATPYVCYDAKATRDLSDQTPDTGAGRGRFRRDLQTFARDAFDDCALDRDGMLSFAGTRVAGTCLVTLRKPKLFCSAAGVEEVGGSPPRSTIATIVPAAPLRAGGLLCYKVRLATKLLSQDLLDAGVLDGQTPPAALFARYRQRVHVRRSLERGTAPHTTPGNGFPAPRQLDTERLDLLCVPSTVGAVSG
jgi:hypothetical protein